MVEIMNVYIYIKEKFRFLYVNFMVSFFLSKTQNSLLIC